MVMATATVTGKGTTADGAIADVLRELARSEWSQREWTLVGDISCHTADGGWVAHGDVTRAVEF